MRQTLTAAPVAFVLISGVLVLGPTAPRVAAHPDGASVISVAVIDYADTMPAVLDQAEKQSARIFGQIGVRTVWQDATPRPGKRPANPPPQDALQGFTIQMIIQPAAPGSRGKASSVLMGAAPESQGDCGGAIYLFYDRIRDTASLHQLSVALVMGDVIAHELGHRLLFGRPHSTDGLMRSPWNASDFQQAALGMLLFSASDAEAVRHAASTCRPKGRARTRAAASMPGSRPAAYDSIAHGAAMQPQPNKTGVGQLRVQDATLKKLIDAAFAGSPTFREISPGLEQSSVIVYTRYGRCRDSVPACMEFITAAPPYIYVRVTVDPFDGPPWELAGLVAHELQHARELSGSRIASLSDFVAFYETHGWHHYLGFETWARLGRASASSARWGLGTASDELVENVRT